MSMALRLKRDFHIFRVLGAGSPSPTLVRLENPAQLWHDRKISVLVRLGEGHLPHAQQAHAMQGVQQERRGR
jgi:hypothetical protein